MAERKPRKPRASGQNRADDAQSGSSSPEPAEDAGAQGEDEAAPRAPRPAVPAPRPTAEERAESAFDVISVYLHPGRENVMLIYILYLLGAVPAFGAIPIIVGFVMALLNRTESEGVWASHYEYQFRQAAIGLLFVIVSAILTVVLIGIIGLILTFVWWIVRSVKGIQAASRDDPIDDPRSYGW